MDFSDNDSNKEMYVIFQGESEEIIERLLNNLDSLEQTPANKELISSINEKCNNCTTSSQVEERVKEFEQEIAQKRQEIVTYTQRIQKAVQLDAKFSKFASDPEKAKLLDKIDMNKITSKLLEPASKNNAGTEDIGEINRGSTEEENTGNDDQIL